MNKKLRILYKKASFLGATGNPQDFGFERPAVLEDHRTRTSKARKSLNPLRRKPKSLGFRVQGLIPKR